MLRPILILIATPVVLLVLAAILLPLLIDRDQLLDLATRTVEEKTGATLKVQGEAKLSIFPTLGVSLGEVSLELPGEAPQSLQARALQIGVQLLPLISREIEIDTLTVDGLQANVQLPATADADEDIRTSELSDEQLDAFYDRRRSTPASASAAEAGAAVFAAPLAINIGKLSITDSHITLNDPVGGEPTKVNIEALIATSINTQGLPMTLSLKLQLPKAIEEETLAVALESELRVDLTSQRVTLEVLQISVEGATLEPLNLSASGVVELADMVADLELQVSSGATKGQGKLHYASLGSPQIDANMTFNLLNPALLALAGPEAAAEAQTDSDPAWDSGDEPLQLQALRAIDTQVEIKIEKAIYQTHAIENLHLQARAVDGVIKINSLTGTLHGGELRMGGTLNVTQDITKIASRGSIKGMDIATLLVALESEPVMSGVASANWQINSRGTTSNELYTSLQGPAKLSTENAVLKDTGIEKMLCQTVALVNQQKLAGGLPSDTAFKDLSMDIQLGNGLAKLKPLRADLEALTLRGQGQLNLLTDKFEADFAARLSPGLAQLDPACAINERYTAIDWPVSCEGNITGNPADWCGVDSGKIIEELGTNEVKRKVQKEAGKLLEGLFNR